MASKWNRLETEVTKMTTVYERSHLPSWACEVKGKATRHLLLDGPRPNNDIDYSAATSATETLSVAFTP